MEPTDGTLPGQAPADDEPILDLGVVTDADTPDHDRQPRDLRTTFRRLASMRVSVLVLIVALFAGTGAGAEITYRQQLAQRRATDESAVSLVLLTDRVVVVIGTISRGELRLRHRLSVVNTGPLPVEVAELRGRLAGLTVRGTSAPVLVKPGVAQDVDVDLIVDCPLGMPSQAVPIELAVRTSDGVTRQASRLVLFRPDPLPVGGTMLDSTTITCNGLVLYLRVTSSKTGGQP